MTPGNSGVAQIENPQIDEHDPTQNELYICTMSVFPKCLVFALTAALWQISWAQCPTDIYLEGQADVENFGTSFPSCTRIIGTVDVSGAVTNLLGLKNLKRAGSLVIRHVDLQSLAGLDSLSEV